MADVDRLPTVWQAEACADQNRAARAARLLAVPLRELCAEIRRRMDQGGTVARDLQYAVSGRAAELRRRKSEV